MASRLSIKEFRSPFGNGDGGPYAETSFGQQQASANAFMYIEHPVNDQVSLQIISMKFGVSIIDLKRINSLQNDRDLYALKSLKVPIKAHSLLAEQYAAKLKYSDQTLTRLIENTPLVAYQIEQQVSSQSSSSLKNSSDEDDAHSRADATSLIDMQPMDTSLSILPASIMNETHLSSSDPMSYGASSAVGSSTSLLLLTNIDNTPATHQLSSNKSQLKEAKRFFQKMDTNLDALKSQNSEILSNVAKSVDDHLVTMPSSYTIETDGRAPLAAAVAAAEKRAMLMNLNLRDTLMLACLIVVFFPLVFLIYRLLL